jgi:hypothetical protein
MCGGPPSQSLLDRNVNKAAHATGKVLDKSLDVGEKVVKETKPVVKKALELGKKGVTKAKDKTREVAKDLKDMD